MTLKLIYQTPESMEGGISPLDDAIMEIIAGGEVSIAAPYLTLSYLQRILKPDGRWRLLTDVDAWLCSQAHDRKVIELIEQFISKNTERVRHWKSLHAKVLLGGKKAIVGSANFTDSGINRNAEMSVEFDDFEQIQELQIWFDLRWKEGTPIFPDALHSSVASVRPPVPTGYFCLPSESPKINSRLRPLPSNGGQAAQIENLTSTSLHKQWLTRTRYRGKQYMCMLAIYSALGKSNRGIKDNDAIRYWDILKSLKLSAWKNYKPESRGEPATRAVFRGVMCKYSLLVKDSDGFFRLAPGVTIETLDIPLNVAIAAETIVAAIDAKLSVPGIQAQFADELQVLDEFEFNDDA